MVEQGDPTVTTFGPADGPNIEEHGDPYYKVASTVWLVKPVPHPDAKGNHALEFSVQTNEGVLCAPFGDYVCYDPKSGHVWPISAEYVAMHYEQGYALVAGLEDAPSEVPAQVTEQNEFGAHLVADEGYTFTTAISLDEDGKNHLVIEIVPDR